MAERPRCLNQRIVYKLEGDEEVMFSLGQGKSPTPRITLGEFGADPKMLKLLGKASEMARKIESGPELQESGSMDVELQGCYRDIRLAVQRDTITGEMIRGITLIGVRRK